MPPAPTSTTSAAAMPTIDIILRRFGLPADPGCPGPYWPPPNPPDPPDPPDPPPPRPVPPAAPPRPAEMSAAEKPKELADQTPASAAPPFLAASSPGESASSPGAAISGRVQSRWSSLLDLASGLGGGVSSGVSEDLSLNTDLDGLSGSGAHAEPEPPTAASVLAEDAGDPGGDGSGAADTGAGASVAAESAAGGLGTVVFGVNQEPDGLGGSAGRCAPMLSSEAFLAIGVNTDPAGLDGLVGSLLAASGRYAPDGLSGARGSGALCPPTRPPSTIPGDSVSPPVCASSASGPGRLLCAPICTTSFPPASVGTAGGNRSAYQVKKRAQ